jgi:hypothetical protein
MTFAKWNVMVGLKKVQLEKYLFLFVTKCH